MEHNGRPDNPVVPVKEAVDRNVAALFPPNADNEGREERVEGKLDVARPDGNRRRAVLEDLLKVHAVETRHGRGDDDGRQANRVAHGRAQRGELLLLDPLVGCRSLGQLALDVGGAVGHLAELVDGPREEVRRVVEEEVRVVGERAAGMRQGHDGDADGEEDEGYPTSRSQRSAEEGYREDGGC